MSEEQPSVPSLRLKPRLRADTESENAAPAPSLPEPIAPAAPPASPVENNAASGEFPSLKLRPKLVAPNSDAGAENVLPPPPALRARSSDAAATPGASAPSFALPPVSAMPPSDGSGSVAPAESADVSRLKLKPRTAAAEANLDAPAGASAVSLPAPMPLPAVRTTPPLPPEALSSPAAMPALPPLPPLSLPPKAPSAGRPPAPAASTERPERPEHSKAFKVGMLAFAAVVLVVLAGTGFLVVRFLNKAEPADAVTAVAKTTPAETTPPQTESASTPEATAVAAPASTADASTSSLVRDPQSLPGKLVAKAQDTVIARERSGQVATVDALLNDASNGTTASKPAARAGKPSTPSANVITKTEPATEEAASVPEAEEIARPAATTAFRAFVVNMRVNGVFQGQPGRAFINGKMYRVGEVVDSKLGIRFSRLDADRKTLFFEDKTTAEVPRRY